MRRGPLSQYVDCMLILYWYMTLQNILSSIDFFFMKHYHNANVKFENGMQSPLGDVFPPYTILAIWMSLS